MKTLFFSLFLLASTQAFSGEKSFECNARYVFGNKTAAITGIITSDTTLSDVTYSIDEQPEFVATILTPAKSNAVSRFAFYREYRIADSEFTLYMPENMNNRETFTAMVGNKTKLEKLECSVEN